MKKGLTQEKHLGLFDTAEEAHQVLPRSETNTPPDLHNMSVGSRPFVPRGAFQTAGTQFILKHDRCQVFCDMGLGKSVMVLNAIDTLILTGVTWKFLVIAPLRVARTTWREECARWDHLKYLRVVPIVGSNKDRVRALNTEADIYCVNYENLPWLVEELKGDWPFRMVIADESTKLKSHRSHFRPKKDGTSTLVCTGGARTNAIARLAFTRTKRWVNLSGTPSPNGLQDLYGQAWFIDKGESLGRSYTAFEDRWYRKGFNGFTMEMLPHAETEIRKAIEPYTFTLRAEDYLDLGEEITNTVFVDLPPTARKLYAEMEKNLFIEIKAGEVEAFSAATKSQKCHQLANGAVYFDKEGNYEGTHDAKIEALESLISEASGMPVIVVYKFKSDLERLKKAFKTGKAFDTEDKVLHNFKQGKIPILFMHPASGGHGIDGLQNVTNIIVFFSVDWNYEERAQVIGRVGKVRQFQAGFDRPVYIHNIVARDTIDEDILVRIETKATVEDALKAGLARRNLK